MEDQPEEGEMHCSKNNCVIVEKLASDVEARKIYIYKTSHLYTIQCF